MGSPLREEMVVSAGSTLVVASKNGDIEPGTRQGLYSFDTRFLSALRLTVQGVEPESLGANQFGHSLASIYASSRGVRGLPMGSISIVRDRYVAQGLHEDISATNHSSQIRRFRLEIAFDADFADVFEVRTGHILKVGHSGVEHRDGQALCIVYRRDALCRETWISFDAPKPPTVNGKTATFELEMEPKERWKVCVNVLPVVETPPQPMQCLEAFLGPPFGTYRRRK